MSSIARRFLATAVVLCTSLACSDDPPTAPTPARETGDPDGAGLYDWAIAPIPGLTSEWHATPPVVVVPVGTTVRFRCASPPGVEMQWSGANEMSRDDTASFAECPVHEAGRVQVRFEAASREDLPPGDKRERGGNLSIVPRSCVIVGIDLGARPVRTASALASVTPLDLGEYPSNEATMYAFFGGGKRFQIVSGLRKVGESRYRTAIGRYVRFEAVADPPEFTPMMEWRIPGQRSRLGGSIERVVHTPGLERIEVGPVQRSRTLELETYSVSIRLAESVDGQIQDGVPVVFVAETTPPGFESDVTWVASTRFGSAIPPTGRGRAFTAVFNSTFGPHPEGGEWRWLGVRADNTVYDQDEKFALAPYEDWEVTGIDPTTLPLFAIVAIQTLDLHAQSWPGDQEMLVGPLTDASCVLHYTGVDHQPHVAVCQLVIDNASHQIFKNGQSVQTLAQMFSPLPFSALPGPTAWMTVAFTRPILFDVTLAQEAVKNPKWKLDNGKFVPGGNLSSDFDPGRGDLTAEEAEDMLGELKTVYGLPDTTQAALKRKAPPKDGFNCHGYTFLKSQRWMNTGGNSGQLIKDIVAANGYTEVGGATGKKAKVGDIVVYEKSGSVTHSGVVTAVDANGNPTKVESKWGNLGTYEHAPGNVPTHFGTPKYYHTDRAGGNCLTQVAC